MKHFIVIMGGISILSVVWVHGYGFCDYFTRFTDHFVMADKVCLSVDEVRAKNYRKIPVRHDGLMTDEIARVLYRSDDVVEYHERLNGECAGATPESVQQRINDQREENSKKAVFYVSIYGTKKDWAFTLCKDGQKYKAAEVTHVDLDRNYKHTFGIAAFRYQQNIYKVTFDVAALSPSFDFILCNGKYKAHATWE